MPPPPVPSVDWCERVTTRFTRAHRDPSVPQEAVQPGLAFLLAQLDLAAANVSAEIEQIHAQALDSHRHALLNYAVAAPVRRLSIPILHKILWLSLPDGWDDHPAGRLHPPFTRVCHVWRTIALSTPRLWTRIKVDLASSPMMQWGGPVMAYIERSGCEPLHIAFDFDIYSAGRKLNRYISATEASTLFNLHHSAWEALCSQAHRWASASLSAVPLSAFQQAPRVPFSQLRQLRWGFNPRPAGVGVDYDIPLAFFATAANLYEFVLLYVTEPLPPTLPPAWRPLRIVIWAGTRRQYFRYSCLPTLLKNDRWPTLAPAMHFLTQAGNFVEDLQLCIAGDAAYDYRSFMNRCRSVPLPAVKRLRLLDGACRLADCFDAPSMLEADFDSWGEPEHAPFVKARGQELGEYWLQEVDGLLCRPPTLTFLRLAPDGCRAMPVDVRCCLSQVPTLQELVLGDASLSDFTLANAAIGLHIVHALTRREDNRLSQEFLPSLLGLTILFDPRHCMAWNSSDSANAESPESRRLYCALWKMLDSRRADEEAEFESVCGLRAFTTNSSKSDASHWSGAVKWPLPEHHVGQLPCFIREWSREAEDELAKVSNEDPIEDWKPDPHSEDDSDDEE
ncbi:hypothetical protein BD626DRAFT_215861 [Schizophyllum amplum]|uniref:F-box domain-containing protein n=1 Tax=Schizophyllum amplum TaxID=97359 RepID=A0A550CKG3_9AGAR|nr:hypothetical protein BD626DRAFT_215861 [Auriculariopsis ampla]